MGKLENQNKFAGTLHTKALDKAQQQPGEHVEYNNQFCPLNLPMPRKGVIRENYKHKKNKSGYVLVVTYFEDANGNRLETPVTHTCHPGHLTHLRGSKKINPEHVNPNLMEMDIEAGVDFKLKSFMSHKDM